MRRLFSRRSKGSPEQPQPFEGDDSSSVYNSDEGDEFGVNSAIFGNQVPLDPDGMISYKDVTSLEFAVPQEEYSPIALRHTSTSPERTPDFKPKRMMPAPPPLVSPTEQTVSPEQRRTVPALVTPSDTEEISFLKQQLEDSQRVVQAVLGVDYVDGQACRKAIRQCTSMKSELAQLKKDHQIAVAQRRELESQWTPLCLERNQQNMRSASLEVELETRQSVASRLGDERQVTNEGSEVATTEDGLYKSHLESQLSSMKRLLDQRQKELETLQQDLAEAHKMQPLALDNQRALQEVEYLRHDVEKANDEIDQLENERQLNMNEIVGLNKQLRFAKANATSVEDGYLQELKETCDDFQTRIYELERERLERIAIADELSRQLEEAQSLFSENMELREKSQEYQTRIEELERFVQIPALSATKPTSVFTTSLSTKAIDAPGQPPSGEAEERKGGGLGESYKDSEEDEKVERSRLLGKHSYDGESSLAAKELELASLRSDRVHGRHNKSTGVEFNAHDSSQQLLDLESHLNESHMYQDLLEAQYRELVEKWEEAEIRRAELEDKRWLREQKMAGLKTMYMESQQRLSILEDEVRASSSAEDSVDSEGSRASLHLMKKKDLKKTIKSLTKDLHSSNRKLKALTSERDDYKDEVEQARGEVIKLLQEKKLLEQQVAEFQRAAQDSEPPQEPKNGDETEGFSLHLQEKDRTIGELKRELTDTRIQLEQLRHEVDQERQSHELEVQQLSKDLDESQAKASTLEVQFSRFIRKESDPQEAHVTSKRDSYPPNEREGEYVRADIEQLRRSLEEKDTELRKKEEEYLMQADQVEELRTRLHDALTSLSDLEFECRFNGAKVKELTEINGSIGDDEVRLKLREKAVQCAELDTKLQQLRKDVVEKDRLIDKLEQEKANNKAKIVELSALWENQVAVDAKRKEIQMKALEIAEHLNVSLERIEQLEIEKEQAAAKVEALSMKLRDSMRTIDILVEKLGKRDRDAAIKEAGIERIDEASDESGEFVNA
jgi:chromosome segregation ATPase